MRHSQALADPQMSAVLISTIRMVRIVVALSIASSGFGDANGEIWDVSSPRAVILRNMNNHE
jgi:hypothetical protein